MSLEQLIKALQTALANGAPADSNVWFKAGSAPMQNMLIPIDEVQIDCDGEVNLL